MEALIASTIVVILAELGDKTQLLAMAFATRFNWKTVMLGVFAATVANHLIAVAVGVYLSGFIDEHTMTIIASIAFIIFGLWTIRGDVLGDEAEGNRFSPFWTVAIAFFVAEMGDKTQFAAVTLAAQYKALLPVLAGTTIGMLVADAVGIIAGVVLHKAIPERTLKWFAAIVFIAIGIFGLVDALLLN